MSNEMMIEHDEEEDDEIEEESKSHSSPFIFNDKEVKSRSSL